MARTVKRNCLKLSLKLVNSTIGIVGVAMIIYSLWMFRAWQLDMGEGSSSTSHDHNFSPPWFILAFLGIGVTLCSITCLGHIAAHTANVHCLSCYMAVIFVLLLVDSALAADIFLNSDWEEDFPEDPTGRFDDFEHFVKSNLDTCKWIGLLIVLAQGCSILLAAVLRNLEKAQARNYDSDDDYAPQRLPFLGYPVHPPPCTVPDLPLAFNNENWNVTIHNKVEEENMKMQGYPKIDADRDGYRGAVDIGIEKGARY